MLLMFLTMNNSKDLTNLVSKETIAFVTRIGTKLNDNDWEFFAKVINACNEESEPRDLLNE